MHFRITVAVIWINDTIYPSQPTYLKVGVALQTLTSDCLITPLVTLISSMFHVEKKCSSLFVAACYEICKQVYIKILTKRYFFNISVILTPLDANERVTGTVVTIWEHYKKSLIRYDTSKIYCLLSLSTSQAFNLTCSFLEMFHR